MTTNNINTIKTDTMYATPAYQSLRDLDGNEYYKFAGIPCHDTYDIAFAEAFCVPMIEAYALIEEHKQHAYLIAINHLIDWECVNTDAEAWSSKMEPCDFVNWFDAICAVEDEDNLINIDGNTYRADAWELLF